ncbi:YeiH family protein [Bacillus taeanensis]|nr:YeiH family protein [Bacillus taeanensis]
MLEKELLIRKKKLSSVRFSFLQGVGLTFLLAILARFAAELPYLEVVGALVLAILFGMGWRVAVGVQQHVYIGISFSSKKLLRLGIIFLGMRLNLLSIVEAGISLFISAVIVVFFTIFTAAAVSKKMNLDQNIGLLTACGTGICGAAAIAAIAPQMKAKDEEVAVSVAVIALLGTFFTFLYVVTAPMLPFTDMEYGFFAGASLHELAHVLAAADAGGKEAVDMAVIMKLTRVILLVPAAMIIGIYYQKNKSKAEKKISWRSLPIPWFIIGFLAMSTINTFSPIPEQVTTLFINAAYLLIGMAMAGLGLNVEFKALCQHGLKAFATGFLGTIFLIAIVYSIILIMRVI